MAESDESDTAPAGGAVLTYARVATTALIYCTLMAIYDGTTGKAIPMYVMTALAAVHGWALLRVLERQR